MILYVKILILPFSSLFLASLVKTYVWHTDMQLKKKLAFESLNDEKRELIVELTLRTEQLMLQKEKLVNLLIQKEKLSSDYSSLYPLVPKIVAIALVGCCIYTFYKSGFSIDTLIFNIKDNILKNSGLVSKSEIFSGKDQYGNTITMQILDWNQSEGCLSVFFGEARELVNLGALMAMKEHISKLHSTTKLLRSGLDEQIVRNENLITFNTDLKAAIDGLEVTLKNQDGDEATILESLKIIESLNIKLALLEQKLDKVDIDSVNPDLVDAFRDALFL
jgi:hypothetical protein